MSKVNSSQKLERQQKSNDAGQSGEEGTTRLSVQMNAGAVSASFYFDRSLCGHRNTLPPTLTTAEVDPTVAAGTLPAALRRTYHFLRRLQDSVSETAEVAVCSGLGLSRHSRRTRHRSSKATKTPLLSERPLSISSTVQHRITGYIGAPAIGALSMITCSGDLTRWSQ